MTDGHDERGGGVRLPSSALPPELVRAVAALHAQSFGWALACCQRREADATDVLQDVYEKILLGRARYQGHASLKTWLFGVIRLTAMEHRRRGGVLVRLFGGKPAEEPPSSGALPDESTEASELRAAIVSALAELSPRQREMMHLVFYEELSIAEAAAVIQVSIGTARQSYDRGKKNMESALARRGIGRTSGTGGTNP